MKIEKRKLQNIHHTSAERNGDGTLSLEFHGRTKSGRLAKFNIRIDFDLLPYAMRELNIAWQKERSARIDLINRLDAHLPKPA